MESRRKGGRKEGRKGGGMTLMAHRQEMHETDSVRER
jgi:hypothetical protein